MILMGYGVVQRIIVMGVGPWLQPLPPIPVFGGHYTGAIDILRLTQRDIAALVTLAGGGAVKNYDLVPITLAGVVQQVQQKLLDPAQVQLVHYPDLIQVVQKILKTQQVKVEKVPIPRQVAAKEFAEVKSVVRKG